MVRKLFVGALVVVAVGLARVVPFTPSGEAQAAAERDVVCASKKCELPAGKEVGTCK